MRKIKIIAQSDIYNCVEIVEEKNAEKRLNEIKSTYNLIVECNKRRTSGLFEDSGLIVTTSVFKID